MEKYEVQTESEVWRPGEEPAVSKPGSHIGFIRDDYEEFRSICGDDDLFEEGPPWWLTALAVLVGCVVYPFSLLCKLARWCCNALREWAYGAEQW